MSEMADQKTGAERNTGNAVWLRELKKGERTPSEIH